MSTGTENTPVATRREHAEHEPHTGFCWERPVIQTPRLRAAVTALHEGGHGAKIKAVSQTLLDVRDGQSESVDGADVESLCLHLLGLLENIVTDDSASIKSDLITAVLRA